MRYIFKMLMLECLRPTRYVAKMKISVCVCGHKQKNSLTNFFQASQTMQQGMPCILFN